MPDMKHSAHIKLVRYAPGVFFLLLCLLASTAGEACIGPLPDFPREIRLDKDKSDPDKDLYVRIHEVSGKTWYIPNPAGFADLELLRKNRDALAHWEEVAAYNLHKRNVAFFVSADVKSQLPEFSQAHIYIAEEQGQAEHDAHFTLTAETPSSNQTMSQAMLESLATGANIDANIFDKAVAEAFSSRPYVFYEKDGRKILVKIGIVEGRVAEGSFRTRGKKIKSLDSAVGASIESPLGGDEHISWHPCVEASLFFEHGGSFVSLLLTFGPLAKQEDIIAVVELLLRWQADFSIINK